MKTITIGEVIHVPPDVAKCPYCDAALACQPTAWDEDDDGSWYASETGMDCCGEPDIDGDEWEAFHAQHSVMPYVNWLPTDNRVLAWLKKTYRFDVKDDA